jgi:hypothetical protein
MAKSKKPVSGTKVKRNIKKTSNITKFVDLLKRWKEVIAIIISAGALIYTVVSYKVSLETSIDSKITESEARTLIQIEVSDMKDDVKVIKQILMEKK